MKAIWKGEVLAKSDHTVVVEGNHYFPAESINNKFFMESSTTTYCPWKGTARYYHIEIDGQTLEDAAWYYPETKDAANHIKGRVAFWKDVEVN